ncbi:hypothetical protein [Kribbella steppae]|uniref:hypothetical protein n=1 Tax=Kribbella steppae TaxID=2512223 RepID=UPI00130DB864|nr:hypothetical protein [Kribbella steppae]
MKDGGHTETARTTDISELNLLRYVEDLIRRAPDQLTSLAPEHAPHQAEVRRSSAQHG